MAAFAASLGAAVAAGELAVAVAPSLGGARIVLDRDPPPSPEYAYGFSSYGGVEHDVFYFELDESAANARASEVVAFGHSHVQLALRPEYMVPKMHALGLSYFNLAFAPAESVTWATELIRRLDLHPKIALAPVGGFFVQRESQYGSLAHRSDAWSAWKRVFEFRARWEITRRLHRLLPYFDWSPRRPPLYFDLYRSRLHGTWYAVREPDFHTPLAWPAEPAGGGPDRVDLARQFQREIESRGGRLVLFQVPSPLASPENARQIARELEVPLLEAREGGFTLTDVSHLDDASSRKFVDILAAQLARLPEVKSLLSAPRASR